VNWYRNSVAAGGCIVLHHGEEYRVVGVEPYPPDQGRLAFPPPFRFVLRALRRKDFRLLRTAPSSRP
jgi:hypothetical protein